VNVKIENATDSQRLNYEFVIEKSTKINMKDRVDF